MMLAMWPTLPGFSIEAIDYQDEGYVIIARANTDSAICPKCQTPSASQHSWYERTPNDLPRGVFHFSKNQVARGKEW